MSPVGHWLCLVFLQSLRIHVCGFIFIDKRRDSLVWTTVAIILHKYEAHGFNSPVECLPRVQGLAACFRGGLPLAAK